MDKYEKNSLNAAKKIWKRIKDKYKKAFEDAAEELMPEEKIYLDLDLNKNQFNILLSDFKEFSAEYTKYQLRLKMNMIQLGTEMARKGNGRVWGMLMSNMQGWSSERVQTQNVTKLETAPNELSDDDLNRELEKRGISVKNFEKIS